MRHNDLTNEISYMRDTEGYRFHLKEEFRQKALSYISERRKPFITSCIEQTRGSNSTTLESEESLRHACNHRLLTVSVHKRSFVPELGDESVKYQVPSKCLDKFGDAKSMLKSLSYSNVQSIAKDFFPSHVNMPDESIKLDKNSQMLHFIVFGDGYGYETFPAELFVGDVEFQVEYMIGALSDFHIGSYDSSVDVVIRYWRHAFWHLSDSDGYERETTLHRQGYEWKLSQHARLHNSTSGYFAPECREDLGLSCKMDETLCCPRQCNCECSLQTLGNEHRIKYCDEIA
jgi:hypothetical protein